MNRFIRQWINKITTRITILISKIVKLVFLPAMLYGFYIAYQFLRKNISIAVCLG